MQRESSGAGQKAARPQANVSATLRGTESGATDVSTRPVANLSGSAEEESLDDVASPGSDTLIAASPTAPASGEHDITVVTSEITELIAPSVCTETTATFDRPAPIDTIAGSTLDPLDRFTEEPV